MIQAAPPQPPTVVVTGRRPDHAKAVRHLTATVTPVHDATEPLARFAAPVCPEAAGLPDAYARAFAERMRADASAAGVRVDAAGCAPNVTVLFVPNGQAVVKQLRHARPLMFDGLESAQLGRLAGDPGPVHLWSFTELRSRDDDRPQVGTTTGRDAPELQVREASIINTPIRVVVAGAIMLVDQGAAEGKTLNQLADYATMRVLAQARPVGADAAEPTVLSMFDRGGTPPVQLTAFDRAYLKALYRNQPTMRSIGATAAMARQINRDLARAVTEKP